MGSITTRTTITGRGTAAAVVLDEETVATIGEGARAFPVSATINGFTWAGRVTRMRGEFLLGMSKAIREGAGVQAGDEIEIEIVLDRAPREVELPPALAEALAADPAARAAWDELAPSYRKEHARSVADAKQDATRARRVDKVMSALRG